MHHHWFYLGCLVDPGIAFRACKDSRGVDPEISANAPEAPNLLLRVAAYSSTFGRQSDECINDKVFTLAKSCIISTTFEVSTDTRFLPI